MPERAERCGEAEPAGVLNGLSALEALSEQPEVKPEMGSAPDELIAVYAGLPSPPVSCWSASKWRKMRPPALGAPWSWRRPPLGRRLRR